MSKNTLIRSGESRQFDFKLNIPFYFGEQKEELDHATQTKSEEMESESTTYQISKHLKPNTEQTQICSKICPTGSIKIVDDKKKEDKGDDTKKDTTEKKDNKKEKSVKPSKK